MRVHIKNADRKGHWALCGAGSPVRRTLHFEGSLRNGRQVTANCDECFDVRAQKLKARKAKAEAAGCERRWRHEHVGGEKDRQIHVFGPKGAERTEWSVLIADDGSICSRFVDRVPTFSIGLPNRPVVRRTRDPIGNNLSMS